MISYETENIRTIALLGHGASGKTSLAEAMLFTSGATTRLGSVEDGTSVADHDAESREKKHTIDSSVLYLTWKGCEINLIDTPGYPDFIRDTITSLASVETVLITLSATEGIQVNTRKLWDMACQKRLAKILVITKIDSENIDFQALVDSVKSTFGDICVPIVLPIGTGHNVQGVANLLELPDSFPDGIAGDAKRMRDSLIETIVSSDDTLMERYLDGKEIDRSVLLACFVKAVTEGHLVPVLCCSNRNLSGIKEVLDAIADLSPSPSEGVARTATVIKTNLEIPVKASADAPFSAMVFKLVIDPFVGKLSYFRIFSGKLDSEMVFYHASSGKTEKAGHIYRIFGKEQRPVSRAVPGDIVALSKLDDLHISDTICDPGHPVKFPEIAFPIPMSSLAVVPKSKGAEKKINECLHKLAEEDKTFKVSYDTLTNELVITGMSNLHLQVMISRLRRRFGIEVETHVPKIPYKETITASVQAQYKHKKQTGGHGQYGEVHIKVEPLPRGAGFEFVDEIAGGVIPRQYIPAVEKGIREAMDKGILIGHPIVDLRVRLHYGSYHDVDSSEASFKIAASHAFRDAFHRARPVLLEPVVNIEVTVPAKFMGEITGNLSSHRGHIKGMEAMGDMQVVYAAIPLASVANYEAELKSMTAGQGSFTMEHSHYDIVPAHLMQSVIAQAQSVHAK
ncbi:MAG: elongation factor G [Candidatus Loosdrechtia sp.]|uniref:elongation factor G n=1 Tax=Candidatus Loosdrechtia sp. TaxID=3101272 RepID=UPI003A69BC81|nr:MAG: elongation factor G [Candidatus Jettenia sp. AMX2]